MCHSLSADGKRTILSPSGAGMMVIFGQRVRWWGIKREILVSVGHYLSSHQTAFLFSWFALLMSTFMSLCFRSMLSSTCSFLVISQKQHAKKKWRTRKEWKKDFTSTIVSENKYLIITYFACCKLVWSYFTHRNAKRQMGPQKEECEICIFANTLKCVLAARAHTSHPLIMT